MRLALTLALAMTAGAAQAYDVQHVTVGIICTSEQCTEVEHPDISPSLEACEAATPERYISLVQAIINAGMANSVRTVEIECRPFGTGA